MSLQLDHHAHSGIDMVTVVGEIDLYSAAQLRESLRQLITDVPRDVVLDISAVPFMDSTALGVLVGALKRARLAGGTLRLAGPDALATKLLRTTGLVKIFSIYPDISTALANPYELPSDAPA